MTDTFVDHDEAHIAYVEESAIVDMYSNAHGENNEVVNPYGITQVYTCLDEENTGHNLNCSKEGNEKSLR